MSKVVRVCATTLSTAAWPNNVAKPAATGTSILFRIATSLIDPIVTRAEALIRHIQNSGMTVENRPDGSKSCNFWIVLWCWTAAGRAAYGVEHRNSLLSAHRRIVSGQ